MSSYINLPHAPPVAHGIPLINPRDDLPDRFRAVFPYQLFNAVQSKCFDSVYNSHDNVVVSAPTGSGKTALLELAICKLLVDHPADNFKIVYQAPTKALCSERTRDWEKKFQSQNVSCAELTGDSSEAERRRVGAASIIITTPEKWDSVTRKWQDHRKLLDLVKLFLIDEVHILKDVRGATLEAVVSRMKTIGSDVRFVALSATVPNSEDIATWLGRNHLTQNMPARRETFGEDLRPVKLQKYVYGYDCSGNDFVLDKYLDQKLPLLLCKHTRGKPILIFCFTRKSCEVTATKLAEWWSTTPRENKPWAAPKEYAKVLNPELQELVKFGVGFHHAGLDSGDRNAIEASFSRCDLSVICCTSTLAVGVNLPCQTVVLKGTFGFSNDRLQELSDLEVMQMLGRAGRPQYDDSATAIILTRSSNTARYEKMVSGEETLESTLHLNLIEHLNSEICLGTITDLRSAKAWLCGSFMSVRMRRNPSHYKVASQLPEIDSPQDLPEAMCKRDIHLLQNAGLATKGELLKPTDYAWAMSKYLVRFSTMEMILGMPRRCSMETILNTLCQATEFKEFRLRPTERPIFRELNKSPSIIYPLNEINTVWHKISLLIQAELGGVQYPDTSEVAKLRKQLLVEKKLALDLLQRLVRSVIECVGANLDSVAMRNALELARSASAGAWEGHASQLTQIPGFGPAAMRRLDAKGITTVLELADQEYDKIEALMGRNPPFGKTTVNHLNKFPRLHVQMEISGTRASGLQPNSGFIVHVTAKLSHSNLICPPNWLGKSPSVTFLAETSDGVLVFFWRGNIRQIDQSRGTEKKFEALLTEANQEIVCYFSCEEIVGSLVSQRIRHQIPPSHFQAQPMHIASGARHIGEIQELSDGISDEDLIAVATEVEPAGGKARIQPSDNEVDIFCQDSPRATTSTANSLEKVGAGETEDKELPLNEAGQLEDAGNQGAAPGFPGGGRWSCRHACSGGALTKAGKACTHRCCREGLEKPPKLKRKGSFTECQSAKAGGSKRTNLEATLEPQPCSSRSTQVTRNGREIDYIDLCGESPSPAHSQDDQEPGSTTPLTGLSNSSDMIRSMHDELDFPAERSLGFLSNTLLTESPRDDFLQGPSPNYPKNTLEAPSDEDFIEQGNPLAAEGLVPSSPKEERSNVPDWVTGMHPDIIDMFRGFVNFV